MQITKEPVAEAGMLIRKPPRKVFRAFVDPQVTTRFWFTKSSGKLEAGKRVRWDWEMYGVWVNVDVKAIEQDRRILIEWGSENEAPTEVEWIFDAQADGNTFVTVRNWGFAGSGDEKVAQALDSTGGFSLVLAGLKALLEHDLDLKLVPDRHPKDLKQ